MSATLDDVMAELRVVRQLLERQARPQLLPEQRAVVIALAEVLGVSSFSTRDALKLLELDIYARPRRCAKRRRRWCRPWIGSVSAWPWARSCAVADVRTDGG